MAETAPTQAEIEAAQAVMRRAAEAHQAEQQARLQPIQDITNSAAFAEVKAAIDGLPTEMLADLSLAPHIIAARTGLQGLNVVAPRQEAAPQE